MTDPELHAVVDRVLKEAGERFSEFERRLIEAERLIRELRRSSQLGSMACFAGAPTVRGFNFTPAMWACSHSAVPFVKSQYGIEMVQVGRCPDCGMNLMELDR
jgi:hypothetical protein